MQQVPTQELVVEEEAAVAMLAGPTPTITMGMEQGSLEVITHSLLLLQIIIGISMLFRGKVSD